MTAPKARGSIKRKLTLIIAISITIVTFVGIGLVYFFGSNLLTNILGKEYSQIADILGTYIVQSFNGEIEDARSYATRLTWIDMIKERNVQYSRMDKDSITRRLEDTDKKWASAEEGSPIVKEYADNEISLGIRDIVKVRGKTAEVFITDRYGGLVAISGKTSGFYQAGEEWWKEAYNNGKGGVFVGDIEFDKPSGKWAVPVAVPITDRSQEVVGVCKDSISLERLFGNLENFKIGNTGHAVLIDGNGRIIFHHGISTMTQRLYEKKELDSLLSKRKPYMVVRNKLFQDKRMFLAFAKIDPPYLNKKGVSWIIFIAQEEAEVLEPLNKFVAELSIVAFLMLILVMPIGSYFGGLVSRPIHELHTATERVMAGDWDYAINIRTGDEIEQFANTFRRMIADIKAKQMELKSFSKNLEIKVEERTKELSKAQEASLNILKDLQTAKEELERTNKELMKLGQLKSDFISTVSHELRTPLSIIKEGISLVLDKIPGEINEKQNKILVISRYNIDRLARIIDSLLDISKIEAGKVELKRSLINIADVVRQTATSFEAKIKEKGLEIRLDIDQVSGKVYADSDRIAQVLTNLIGNAVKFTQKGYIEVSCKDKKDIVVCTVSDTGVGIAKDNIPKIFDKFQQFGRVAGAGEKGTGLGLSIAKSIIDMHNGSISVESEEDKGSKFTFLLRKYTEQSLFKEYVQKAIMRAKIDKSKLSIIEISAKTVSESDDEAWNKKLHGFFAENIRLIKNTLRREGDDVVSNDGEMIVIVSACNGENAGRVQHRIEEILDKNLIGQKLEGSLQIYYAHATYPDDAKNDTDLLEKTKAILTLSLKQ